MLKADIKPEILMNALKVIATSSGTEGMIGGQVVDMGESVESYEDLTYLHARKTGALISASLVAGYIAGGGNNPETANILKEYSAKLGLSFQVIDDILDVTGDEALLGKPVGSDAKNKKSTYVSLVGLERAKADVIDFTNKAKKSLNSTYSLKIQDLFLFKKV
jgi:geranylgeranyl diphosphate synthase type II